MTHRQKGVTPWDLGDGEPQPALKEFMESTTGQQVAADLNAGEGDEHPRALVPGCGRVRLNIFVSVALMYLS